MSLNLVAPIYDPSGYASLAREIAKGLYFRGVNTKLYPINNWDTSNIELTQIEKEIFTEQQQTELIGYAPILSIAIPEQWALHPMYYSIGFSMIETSGIPEYWVRMCNYTEEIWVPTTASKESFANSGVDEDKINVYPLGVDIHRFNTELKPLEMDVLRGFNFLINIEWVPRKCGPETVESFLTEFNAEDDVSLILKAYNAQQGYSRGGVPIVKEIKEIKEKIGKKGYPPIVFLPQIVPSDDMPRLYASCDCVIQASRGEGWGLPVTEGMACGKPYIASNCSGLTDIISKDTGYLLDITGYSTIPPYGVPNDRVIAGFEWADPDFEHLKHLMRYVFEHQEESKQKGSTGRKYAENSLSWETSVDRVYNRLLEVGKENRSKKIYRQQGYQQKIEKPKAMFVVPSMGKRCGIADYTMALSASLSNVDSETYIANIKTATPNPNDFSIPDVVWDKIKEANILHFQVEYGLFSVDDFNLANKAHKNKKIVCTQHSIDELAADYNFAIHQLFDKIIVSSIEMLEAAVYVGYPPDKIVVIPQGCWEYEHKAYEPGDIKKIASFGFMFPQKGWVETVLAIKNLKKYEWYLYSSPVPNHSTSLQYNKKFSSFLKRTNIENIVWKNDYLPEEELMEKISEADLIVMPYTVFKNQHAISSAIRRCLGLGVPILCTDITYFSDLEGGVFKIPTNSTKDIIEGISYLDTQPELRRALVSNADEYVKNNSWDIAAERHLNFWKEL